MIFEKIRSQAEGVAAFDAYKDHSIRVKVFALYMLLAGIAWYFGFFKYYYVALAALAVLVFAQMIYKMAKTVIIGVTDYDKNNPNLHI